MKNQYLTVKYNNFPFRVILSFLAALFIVKYGVEISIVDALSMPSFYLSVCQSFAIVFLLVMWVHCLTVLLDRIVPWKTKKWIRVALQVTICWIVPCILAYGMAMVYFYHRGVNIDDTDYELMELPLVNLLLLFLNYYYYNKYNSIKDKHQLGILNRWVEQNPSNGEAGSLPDLPLRYNGNIIKLSVCTEVACFYKAIDGYWVKPLEGNSIGMDQSLVRIEDTYVGHSFFKLNRALIINRKAIKSYITNDKNGSLQVEMYKDIGGLEHKSKTKLFIVNSRHAQEFIDWYNAEA